MVSKVLVYLVGVVSGLALILIGVNIIDPDISSLYCPEHIGTGVLAITLGVVLIAANLYGAFVHNRGD